ncbi:MAG: hypothetical protein IIT46_18220 [Lachnospiraceae bacterium]|nr:hypothetical protein [Lachnospiraceae bacterium]
MKKKEQKIVRFYSDNPEHRKAFDILQKINAEKYSSIQDFIISAINLLGDMELNEECPTVDRKDWEEPLIERIAETVETIINEKLPQIIASYLLGIQTGQTTNSLPAAERVTKEVGENENGMEKDVEANDMLDLDSFFS